LSSGGKKVKKKIFAIILVAVLAGVLIANILNTSADKKKQSELEESYAVESADEKAKTKDMIGGSEGGLEKGDRAYPFELKTLDGENVKLSDYQGKKVILNFWATWCPPCQAEMPHMQNFYETKAEEMNVEILAVNLTKADKGIEKVKSFVTDYGLTFPIPMDEKGVLGSKYQAFAIPTTYIIDTKGNIQNKIVGPMDEEMMIKLVKEVD